MSESDNSSHSAGLLGPGRNDLATTPIFRVVEMVRDADGRLRHEGRVWHTDLGVTRRLGRALAANTASHRVVVADAHGNVLEDIAVQAPGESAVNWQNWQDVPLPPLPPRSGQSLKPKRKAPVPPPARSTTPQQVPDVMLALDAAAQSLQRAADHATVTAAGEQSMQGAELQPPGADVTLP